MSTVYSKPENIFQIFFNGILIYLKKFLTFSRAMFFPVFGQVAGIILILAPVYFYRQYFLLSIPVEKLQENMIFIFLGLLLIVIPGFAIFLKAFWDYMVAMVSLNTITADIIEKNSIDNFKEHNERINSRSKDYIILLLLLMGVWLVLIAAPFVVLVSGFVFLNKIFATVLFSLSGLLSAIILAIASVFLCLSFQIFAFEKINPVNILKTSFNMIKNSFWEVIILGILLFIVTGSIIPYVFQVLIKSTSILSYIAFPFEVYINILLENPIIASVQAELGSFIPNLAEELALFGIGSIVTAFLLPMGSACFTLLYFDIKKCKQSEV